MNSTSPSPPPVSTPSVGDVVVFDFTDPWVVAATILFSLLAAVALYRSSRACCICKMENN